MEINTHELNDWQKQLFAAALLQRMLPNYQYFSDGTGFGNSAVLNNILDIIWQKLAGMSLKFDVEAQTEKLIQEVPEPKDFQLYAVFPALDFCTGLECLLGSFQDKSIDSGAEVSQLSLASVCQYLEFLASQSELGDQLSETPLQDDPLYQWESDTQAVLLDVIKKVKKNKEGIREVKQIAIGDKISSLGLEYS